MEVGEKKVPSRYGEESKMAARGQVEKLHITVHVKEC